MSGSCCVCGKYFRSEQSRLSHQWYAHFRASEDAADSPGGVSGRILCSPAERSEAGNKGETDGQSRVPRRSEAEPGNDSGQARAIASRPAPDG